MIKTLRSIPGMPDEERRRLVRERRIFYIKGKFRLVKRYGKETLRKAAPLMHLPAAPIRIYKRLKS